MLLDIKSAFDLEAAIWRFGGPALVVFLAELAYVRLWAPWFLYPVMIALALFAGTAYYWSTDLRHRRRLKSLRQEQEGVYWGDTAILVKKIEVPETTMYYGFFAGKTYASRDRERLARVLAERADELVNQAYRHPSPAIEERYASLLKQNLVTLDAWRDEIEKPRIGDRLVEVVHNASEQIIPKEQLADLVIDEGRRYTMLGLIYTGFGHDPDLVAECYQDLVDAHALVEVPIEISDEDEEGTRTVTAVRLGDDPLPGDMATLRANFSARFRGRALESRYQLPVVEPEIQVEPFVPPETAADEVIEPTPTRYETPEWWSSRVAALAWRGA